MYAVGVDVSNGKSSVAVLKSKREAVMPTFDVTHTTDGLAALVEKLSALDGEVRIVMEHTGRYYESIAAVLHNAGFYVSAVNPLLIKGYNGNTLRRRHKVPPHLLRQGPRLPQGRGALEQAHRGYA